MAPTVRAVEPLLNLRGVSGLETLFAGIHLDFSRNQITSGSIQPGHFDDVQQLKAIDLSENALTMVPMIRNTWLQRLDIGGNLISDLPRGIFSGLPRLATLLMHDLANVRALPAGVLFQPENPLLDQIEMQRSGVVAVSPSAFNRTVLVEAADDRCAMLYPQDALDGMRGVRICVADVTRDAGILFDVTDGPTAIEVIVRIPAESAERHEREDGRYPLAPWCRSLDEDGASELGSIGVVSPAAIASCSTTLAESPAWNASAEMMCDVLPPAPVERLLGGTTRPLTGNDESTFCRLCPESNNASMCFFKRNRSERQRGSLLLLNASVVLEFTTTCTSQGHGVQVSSTFTTTGTTTTTASTADPDASNQQAQDSSNVLVPVAVCIVLAVMAVIVAAIVAAGHRRNRPKRALLRQIREMEAKLMAQAKATFYQSHKPRLLVEPDADVRFEQVSCA